jgi:hypothetical protein
VALQNGSGDHFKLEWWVKAGCRGRAENAAVIKSDQLFVDAYTELGCVIWMVARHICMKSRYAWMVEVLIWLQIIL